MSKFFNKKLFHYLSVFLFLNSTILPVKSSSALAAWSLKTYIRFEQRDFKISDDFVAIENVTIIANAIPADWETSENWLESKKLAVQNDREAQCCFNSRKCEKGYGTRKNENPSLNECGKFAGYYNFAEEVPMATTGESFVLLWIICLLLGFEVGIL